MMNKFLYPALAAAVLVVSGFSAIKVTSYKIDPDFEIKFDSEDPSGKFEQFSGTIQFDPNDLVNSKFDITIPVGSINCGSGLQNKHAKSSKWFDETKYPNITYQSKSIIKTDKGFEVSGILAIREIEKEYKIPFTFSNNTFIGSFTVNRNDFEIGTPGGHASDELAMSIKVPVSQ